MGASGIIKCMAKGISIIKMEAYFQVNGNKDAKTGYSSKQNLTVKLRNKSGDSIS